MNFKKLFGLGVLIWLIVYVVAAGFVGYKVMETNWARIVLIIVVALVAFFAGRNLKLEKVNQTLKYSLGWVIIAGILDLILTVPFTGWKLYSSWDLWLGYALVLLVPLLTTKKVVV